MIIKNIIVHLIDKLADSGASTLVLNEQMMTTSPALESFVEQLNKIYNSKPSKAFGCFIEQQNSDNERGSISHLLSDYLQDKLTFMDYSWQSMQLLKYYIDQSGKATGGYIIFVHYTLFGVDFMLIAMLNKVMGVAVDEQLKLNNIDYLDIAKIHLAASINLSEWQDEPHSKRYISMICGQQSNKLSDYFKKFIGSDETIDSKQETKQLMTAMQQYSETHITDEDERAEFRKKATEFCLEQADNGKNVALKDFSNYVADNAVDDFMNYIKAEQFSLNDEVSPNKTVLRRFNKISGRNQQLSITINEDALGDTIIFDAEKETLTLSDLPATLKAQLLSR